MRQLDSALVNYSLTGRQNPILSLLNFEIHKIVGMSFLLCLKFEWSVNHLENNIFHPKKSIAID